MRHTRAFSLLEMVVALAMSAVIAAAAVAAGAAINSVMGDNRRRAVVWDETKRLEEALLSRRTSSPNHRP
jgi:prepilin-type N-terminal cleavage/methylation domain-containing protein